MNATNWKPTDTAPTDEDVIVDQTSLFPFRVVRKMVNELCPNDRPETVESRLKQWQKLDFPRSAKVGKYRKALYTTDDLFGIAVVSELQQMGIGPARAIQFLAEASVAEIIGLSAMGAVSGVFIAPIPGSKSRIQLDLERIQWAVFNATKGTD